MDGVVESDAEGALIIDEREDGELDDDEETRLGHIKMRIPARSTVVEGTSSDMAGPSDDDHAFISPTHQPSSSSMEEIPPLTPPPSSTAAGGGAITPEDPMSPTAINPKARRLQWGIGEMMLFYEGIRQYGKDFDMLSKHMAKRKVERDKEQLRNFFFNFFKVVRCSADLKEEEWPPEITRDARDLFAVINGCEWKRRTDNSKFEQAKLKALIMEGSTIAKVYKRQQHVTIKTPCCPALIQFFSFNRRITRFPTDINLYLGPRRHRDGTNVMSRGQNKHLCIRLNTSDRLERIFDLLHHKWKVHDEYESMDERPRGKAGGEEKREKRRFRVRLFPARETLMGDVSYTPSPSGFGNVSIKMLKEDRLKAETIKRQIKRGQEPEAPCYHASQCLLQHLSISRDALIGGVSKTDVGSASVAELYAVCGLTSNIALSYAIDEEEEEGEEEAWDVMVGLLMRGYGEITADRKISQSTAGAGGGMAAGDIKTPPFDSHVQEMMLEMDGNYQPQLQPVATRRPMKRPVMMTSPSANFFVKQSPIVSEEMDDFAEQMREFSSKPPRARARRSPILRKRIAHQKGAPAAAAASSASAATTPSHGATTFPHIESGRVSVCASSRSSVDAKSITGKRIEIQNLTPVAGPSSSKTTTTFPQMGEGMRMDVMGGGEGEEEDLMGRALRAAFTSPGNTLGEAPSTSHRLSQEESSRAAAALFQSPTKNQSTLPADVRLSMEQMMSQNSVDYCLSFAQLISHTTLGDSPSKLSRL